MKRVLLAICSILLVLACLFSIYGCLGGLQDIQNIQDYKTSDKEDAMAGLAEARDGIEQLEENELAYTEGVGAFEDGKVQLENGKIQLAAGAAQLAAGEAAVAEGQAQIDANTDAYNEGKASLEQIEPVMPYVDKFVEFRDENLSDNKAFSKAQEWVADKVRPIAGENGIEIPEDSNDLAGSVQNMVTDGKAQLQQYEDGLAALNQGKAELAAGYADYAAGQQQLAEGEKQLEEGNAQLTMYEEGQAALAKGMNQLLDGMGAAVRRSGEEVSPSLKTMLGEDFSLYLLDEQGNPVKFRDCDFVDLDACTLLCDKAEEYLDMQEGPVTDELYGRVATYAVAAVASILGLIAGIFGIVAAITGGVKTGKNLGIISAVLALAANAIGYMKGYTDYIFQTRNVISTADVAPEDIIYTYSGDLQFKALVALAIAAVIFVIFSAIAKKSAKKGGYSKKHKTRKKHVKSYNM